MILPNKKSTSIICSDSTFGEGCRIGDYSVIKRTKFGSNVLIGNYSLIGDVPFLTSGLVDEFVVIGSNVDISSHVIVSCGVSIGSNVVIKPFTVINSDIPDFSIVSGNPAVIVGRTDSESWLNENLNKNTDSTRLNTDVKLVEVNKYKDVRGQINILECYKDNGFICKRIFYTTHVPFSKLRGEHAHKTCNQILISLKGTLQVIVDNGFFKDLINLGEDGEALFIPAGIWATQFNHSVDNILLVLASEEYDKNDYINNYSDYLKFVGGYSV